MDFQDLKLRARKILFRRYPKLAGGTPYIVYSKNWQNYLRPLEERVMDTHFRSELRPEVLAFFKECQGCKIGDWQNLKRVSEIDSHNHLTKTSFMKVGRIVWFFDQQDAVMFKLLHGCEDDYQDLSLFPEITWRS